MGGETKIDPKLLKRLIPLNTLSDHGFQSILNHAEFFYVKKGSRLFKQGDTEQFHFYLISGAIRLEADGVEQERIDARDDAAKFPIAHQLPRRCTARALDKIRFMRLDSQFLSTILANSGGSDYEVSELNYEGGDEDEDWMTQVLRSRIFQMIPPSNIQKVLMHMEEHPVSAGDVVYRQGEEGDYFYMINRGHCRVERDMNDGNPPVELGELGPGAGFGEESLITGERRTSTVTVVAKGRLLRLNKIHFNAQVKAALPKPYGYQEARKAVETGAVWLDVREPEEFDKGHLPEAINIPFNLLRYQADSLDPERNYIICCTNGKTSPAAAFQLTDRGLNVTVLDHGLDTVPPEDLERSEMDGEEMESAAQIDLQEIEQSSGLEQGREESNDGKSQRLEMLTNAASKLKRYAQRLERDKRRLEEKRIKEVRLLREALEKAHKKGVKMERHYLAQKKEGDALRAEIEQVRQDAASGKVSGEELSQARAEAERYKAGLAEMKGVREHLAQARTELAQLRASAGEAKGLQEQLAHARAEIERYKAGLIELKGMREQLLQNRTELEQFKAGAGETKGLHEQLSQLRSQAERLKAELVEFKAVREQLGQSRAEVERLKGGSEESKALRNQLAQAQTEIDRLKEGLEEQKVVREQLSLARAEVERLKIKATAAEAGNKELAELRKELLEAQAALNNEVGAMESAEQQLFELEKREEVLRNQLATIEGERAAEERRAAELEKGNRSLHEELNKAKLELREVEQRARGQSAELENLRSRKEQFAVRLENEMASKISAEERLAILERRAETQRTQLDRAEEQRNLAEQKAQSLALELDNLRTTMAQFVSQLEGERGDVDQIMALTTELDMVQAHAEEEALGYRNRIAQLEGEIRRLQG